MELHLTTEGTQLRKRGECFLVSTKTESSEWSARKVERIIIGPHIFLTSDVVELAIENHVDLVFVRWSGEPLGRIWHPGHGSTAAIRRAQLLVAANTIEAVTLVKGWAAEKLANQEAFLRDLAKNKRNDASRIVQAADALARAAEALPALVGDLDLLRPVLMGHEGIAARHYFEGLCEAIPGEFRFEERSRRPARDPFNATLNYGYGMLYARVERALIIAGLDPYLGFLHTDRYNKPSLVFDFIEPFREWVDRPVVRLFTQKKLAKGDFEEGPGKITLQKSAKQKLVMAVNGHLADDIPFAGRKQRREKVLQARAHQLAMAILKGEVCSSGSSTTSPTTACEVESPDA